MQNKISVVSLGCPKNLVDSDTLLRKLAGAGFSIIQSPEDADIILINTCGFINDAKKESIEEILRLAEIKNGAKALIVLGCLAKRYSNELIKEIPEIDALFGVGEDEKIVEYCTNVVRKRGSAKVQKIENGKLPNLQTSYAYLKISEGCDKKCSYCVIPSIRGSYRSMQPDDILKEAARLVNTGVKELILVGQDTACYGKDLKGYDITSLLRDICAISGNFRVRVLYTYPSTIKDPFLKVIAEENKICKYLDMPLQHSERRILKLMRRGGARNTYINLIKNIRSGMPDITLRTTFIVGFPTETIAEFNSLLDFAEKAQFDRLGAFKYSNEEGTAASRLKGQVTETIKKKRYDKLMQMQAYISLAKNKKLVGRRFKALVDETDGKTAIARLHSQAPEIDGAVIIESSLIKNSKLGTQNSELKVGDFVDVEITDAFEYDLKGRLVK